MNTDTSSPDIGGYRSSDERSQTAVLNLSNVEQESSELWDMNSNDHHYGETPTAQGVCDISSQVTPVVTSGNAGDLSNNSAPTFHNPQPVQYSPKYQAAPRASPAASPPTEWPLGFNAHCEDASFIWLDRLAAGFQDNSVSEPQVPSVTTVRVDDGFQTSYGEDFTSLVQTSNTSASDSSHVPFEDFIHPEAYDTGASETAVGSQSFPAENTSPPVTGLTAQPEFQEYLHTISPSTGVQRTKVKGNRNKKHVKGIDGDYSCFICKCEVGRSYPYQWTQSLNRHMQRAHGIPKKEPTQARYRKGKEFTL